MSATAQNQAPRLGPRSHARIFGFSPLLAFSILESSTKCEKLQYQPEARPIGFALRPRVSAQPRQTCCEDGARKLGASVVSEPQTSSNGAPWVESPPQIAHGSGVCSGPVRSRRAASSWGAVSTPAPSCARTAGPAGRPIPATTPRDSCHLAATHRRARAAPACVGSERADTDDRRASLLPPVPLVLPRMPEQPPRERIGILRSVDPVAPRLGGVAHSGPPSPRMLG